MKKNPLLLISSLTVVALLSGCTVFEPTTPAATDQTTTQAETVPVTTGTDATVKIDATATTPTVDTQAVKVDTVQTTPTSTVTPATAPVTPVPTPTPAPAVEPTLAPQPVTHTFNITAKDFSFSPASISVKKGDTVVINVTSVDNTHGLSISDFGINLTINQGETKTARFVADKAGSFTMFCSVFCGGGHSSMKGTLTVTE